MERPHIDYPCLWTYAIVGPDEEDLRLAVGEVAKGLPHRITFSKMSAHKRYVSLHVEIRVDSEEERNRHFQAFQSHPHVRFVL